MAYFQYEPAVLARFPTTRGAVVCATQIENGPASEALSDLYTETQETVKREVGDTPLSDLEELSAWRRTFSGFGVKPTQYRNAAESLLRRLTKQGDIPPINRLVDIANLVSITHRLPVAVFDQESVSGGTTVRFASGTESFTDLGSKDVSHPDEGEVIFADESGVVSARRWCWRQSEQSAAGPNINTALVTIEGQHEGAETAVAAAAEQLASLLDRFCPSASHSIGSVGPDQPRFDPPKLI